MYRPPLPETFPLSPGKRWRSRLLATAVIGVMTYFFAFMGLASLAVEAESAATFYTFLMLPTLLGLVAGAWAFSITRPPKQLAPIVLGEEVLRLPVGGEGRWIEIPLVSLWVARRCGHGPGERLLLGSRGAAVVSYPVAELEEPDAAERLLEGIRARLAALPGGHAALLQLERRGRFAEHVFSTFSPVTWGLTAVLVAAWSVQIVMQILGPFGALAILGPPEPMDLLLLGANSAELVRQGEWHRLVTASMLHGHWAHLFLNAAMLVMVGRMFESLLGPARYLVVFLTSCLAGAAASALAGSWLSVGASTGIAGLVGAYVLVRLLYREEFPLPPTRSFWIILAASLLIPMALFWEHLDHAGHLGGALAGAAITSLFVLGRGPLALRSRPSLSARLGAGALVLLFLFTGWMAAVRAFVAEPGDRLPIATHLLQSEEMPVLLFNNLAWELATAAEATTEQLEIALGAMERLREELPGEAAFEDTRATLLYRLGDLDAALEIQRPLAVPRSGEGENGGGDEVDPIYASQLARFELARARREGGPQVLDRPRSALPTWSASARPGLLTLRLEARECLEEGASAHAALVAGDRLLAHVAVELGPSDTASHAEKTYDPETIPFLQVRGEIAGGVDVVPTFLGPPSLPLADGELRWYLTPIDRQIRDLP